MEQHYSQLPRKNESDSDEDRVELLSDSEDSNNLIKYRQARWINLHITVLYIVLAVLSTLFGIAWLKRPHNRDLGTLYSMLKPREPVYDFANQIAPARDVVEYHQHRFTWNFWDKGAYMGFPTDEVDQRWSDLYNCRIIPHK